MYQQYPYGGVPGAPQPKMGWWERRKMTKQARQIGADPGMANYQQSLQVMKVVGKNNDMVQFMHKYPDLWKDIVHAIEVSTARLLQLQRKSIRTTLVIPAYETTIEVAGKPAIIKIPEIQAVLKMEFIDPDNKPTALSIHDQEYEAALSKLTPKEMKNVDDATLESDYKAMEEGVVAAIQPPPEMMGDPYGQPYGPPYGPPYQEEPGMGSKILGLGLDTLAFQATGKPRQPQPPSPYQ